MSQTIKYKHCCNSGDVIASMASLRQIWKETGKRAEFMQQFDVPAHYYDGAAHPVKDEAGKMVCMNEKQFSMLAPLLKSQQYIHDCYEWVGQPNYIDLDKIRSECYVGIPAFAIQNWLSTCFPDMQPNLSEPWIQVNTDNYPQQLTKDDIVINRTQRYTNEGISYFFLKEYESKLVFAGTKEEYRLFCERWNLNIRYLEVADFYELACNIKAAKFLIGNQSFCWNLAEAMKTPRILELCTFAPNCIHGIGEHSYGFLYQGALEYYVKKLAENL